MPINWISLRPWNGSLQSAFEQLCCQLAASEKVPTGASFIRKAAPDAGIECYWRLGNGDEWAWQAKFFTSVPSSAQWRDLDESVKTAIKKHPRLTSYTVCLPIDRQDPRIPNQTSFMAEWDKRVAKWQKLAADQGRSIEFRYWGEHEVFQRLTMDEHKGRYRFWFDKELFSESWLRSHITETVENVGPRYTRPIHVELPIRYIFEELGWTSAIDEKLRKLQSDLRRALINSRTTTCLAVAGSESQAVQACVQEVQDILLLAAAHPNESIDLTRLEAATSRAENATYTCAERLVALAEENEKQRRAAQPTPSQSADKSYQVKDFSAERHHLRDLTLKLSAIHQFVTSESTRLLNTPALLLVGNAGQGKTHLLCDVALGRLEADLPTFLFLGTHFAPNEPWSEMIKLAGLQLTKEEFLGAIQALAEASGRRALLLIDALNEGDARDVWSRFLAGMLTALSRYPLISLGITVRSSYEPTVIPDGIVPDKLIRIEHPGFAQHEYEATRTFFDYYGIQRPSIPILTPEFQNPLFLKLFCQALRNSGLIRVPPGLHGITTVFGFFLESVNKKLAKPDHLDFDIHSQLVQQAVNLLATRMGETSTSSLDRSEAKALVDSLLPGRQFDRSLFRHLIAEGVLSEDREPTASSGYRDVIRFAYERLADHAIARVLLDRHLSTKKALKPFRPNGPLGKLLKDEMTAWQNRGLLDALSVQLPERTKKELFELAPWARKYSPVRMAFVDSLLWRDPKAFTNKIRPYVNTVVIQFEGTHDQFWNVILTVATNPTHPYNADYLHRNLLRLEMAERDEWWSIFVHQQFGNHGAIDSLVDWALLPENKTHIDDDAIRLAGIVLSWFLTTSNRFLRDHSTKALVRLFSSRIAVFSKVLTAFESVNDLYVLERLYAAAYGCAMRTQDVPSLVSLAGQVYEMVFANGDPPPHFLLRDYARGVIEAALRHGPLPAVDIQKVRPPYNSTWPATMPTENAVKPFGESLPNESYAERGRHLLYESLMSYGDFARYVLGSDSYSFPWTSRPLRGKRPLFRKELVEVFEQKLTKSQLNRFHRLRKTIENGHAWKRADPEARRKHFKREISDDKIDALVRKATEAFQRSLKGSQARRFKKDILPYYINPSAYAEEHSLDMQAIARWILQKVVDLGWTVQRFGEFDASTDNRSNRGREPDKAERIGKKYQWLAYYEILARAADSLEFRERYSHDESATYSGPWQLHVRNIDPSCLLSKTGREQWHMTAGTWWFPVVYDAWKAEGGHVDWLKTKSDLPDTTSLVAVMNPADNSTWFVLEGHLRWEQPVEPGEDREAKERRDLWYIVNSYFVKTEDFTEVFTWAKKQDFAGRRMPESRDLHGVFLGEFWWAPAYRHHDTPNYGGEQWTVGDFMKSPKPILVTGEGYLHEGGGYDCSTEDSISIQLPTKSVVAGMNLDWKGMEGCLYDQAGTLVAFDPSVKDSGPSVLLIRQESLLSFLKEKKLALIWTVLGEKNLMGGSIGSANSRGWLGISGAGCIKNGKPEFVTVGRFKTQGI